MPLRATMGLRLAPEVFLDPSDQIGSVLLSVRYEVATSAYSIGANENHSFVIQAKPMT